MIKLPWKTKGMMIAAPRPHNVGLFEEFVEKKLAPGGCNLIVLRVCYGYNFTSHPECASPDQPLSLTHVKRIVNVCRKNGIKLIPKMNLMGHQAPKQESDYRIDRTLGLLRGHPEFGETPPDQKIFYCPSLCPNHPDIKPIVFDLMDEMLEVFEADALHIGMDEVFTLGECERCKNISPDKLFADWTNTLHRHIKSRGARTLMWGDHLLPLSDCYSSWHADNRKNTENAINLIDKDILICDWHYHYHKNLKGFPSVDIFADKGFKMLVSPLHLNNTAPSFIDYAIEHDRGHIEGLLLTSWEESYQIAGYMLENPDDYSGHRFNLKRLQDMTETIDMVFGNREVKKVKAEISNKE